MLYSGEEDFTDVWRWTAADGVSTFGTNPSGSSETLGVDATSGDLFVGTSGGSIYRYVDLNGDGDARDAGEITLFKDNSIGSGEVEAMGVFHQEPLGVPTLSPLGLTALALCLLLFGFVGYANTRR